MTRTSKVLTRHDKDIQGLNKAWQERARWTTPSRRPPTARTRTSTRQDLGRLWRWLRSDRSSLTLIRSGLAFELLALLLVLKIILMKALAITVIQVVFGFCQTPVRSLPGNVTHWLDWFPNPQLITHCLTDTLEALLMQLWLFLRSCWHCCWCWKLSW